MGLVKKSDSEANKKIFIDELKRAILLVQLYITPPPMIDENGKPQLGPESKLNIPAFNIQGKKYFGVYTDLGEIKKINVEGEPIVMPYGLKQLSLAITQTNGNCDGIIINPGSNSVIIDNLMLAAIMKHISKTENEK